MRLDRMWLLRGLASADGPAEDPESAEEQNSEKEWLAEEAEELRLKLEALRMAEYREAQRAACRAQDQIDSASAQPSSSSAATADAAAEAAAVHFHIDDGDIEEMYDYSGVVHDAVQPARRREAHEDEDCRADLEHLRLVEARLQQRERTLQAQVDAQEQKLVAASRALQKTRGQAQQLMEQLGSKESQGSQLNVAAVQLERLLAEKERRLKAALDEAAAALTNEKVEESAGSQSVVGEGGTTQQPQEAPTSAVPRPPEPAAVDEEQLLQLAAMTEELTDALQQATESEEEVQRELEAASARLQEERQQRMLSEQELDTVRQARDIEVNTLLARIQEQERSLAAEKARVQDMEARVRLAETLREAEERRSRGEVFYPHLEI